MHVMPLAAAASGSGGPPFEPAAIEFSGGTEYLSYGVGEGAMGANSAFALYSLWINPDDFVADARGILLPDANTGGVYLYAIPSDPVTFGLQMYGIAAAGTLVDNSAGPFPVNQWMHILVSVNLTVGDRRGQLYINGVAAGNFANSGAADVIPLSNRHNLAALLAGIAPESFVGCMAEFWFDAIDVEITPAVVAKFYDAGAPVYLGVNGEIPFGSIPLRYESGNAATFPVERGSLASPQVVGTPTDCATGP